MRAVGIRELKAQLSQVLRDVQRGDVVLITDRGRVVAELRSPDTTRRAASPEEEALARLAASGELRLADERREPYPASPLRSPPGTAKRLLDQERGER